MSSKNTRKCKGNKEIGTHHFGQRVTVQGNHKIKVFVSVMSTKYVQKLNH